jgi:hypothetical protein
MEAAVKAWRAEHGDWCPGGRPGEDHPAHRTDPSNPLTAEHVRDVGRHGEGGELVVVCRTLNSRRGATLR